MPVEMGEARTKIFIFIYAAALPPLSLGLWIFGYCSGYYAAAAAALGTAFILYCYGNLVASRRFGKAFGASIVYILCLLLAIILDISFLY